MSFSSLFALVFKFFKAQPIGRREILLHLCCFLLLLSLISLSFAEERRLDTTAAKSFSLGFLFASLYLWLFFLSAEGFFKPKAGGESIGQTGAMLCFLLKWCLLLGGFLWFKGLLPPFTAAVSFPIASSALSFASSTTAFNFFEFFVGLIAGGLSLISLYIYSLLKRRSR